MNPSARAATLLAGGPALSFLQAFARTCFALNERVDVYVLASPFCGIHERDVGLNLDVLSYKNLFLKRRLARPSAPPPTTSESPEEVFKVDIRAKSSVETLRST